MSVWFFACAIGFLTMMPLHFWSVEHQKLQQKFGKAKGVKIGKILGAFSGWMELLLLLGLWIAPQPRFVIFSSFISITLANFSISIFQLAIGLPLISLGAWIALKGVWIMSKATGMEAVDAHCKPSKIVTSFPYSVVRHPQYLGADLACLGGSVLLSAFYALWFTPVYLLSNYLISWKEEKELVREFGGEYEGYRREVPMFIPRF